MPLAQSINLTPARIAALQAYAAIPSQRWTKLKAIADAGGTSAMVHQALAYVITGNVAYATSAINTLKNVYVAEGIGGPIMKGDQYWYNYRTGGPDTARTFNWTYDQISGPDRTTIAKWMMDTADVVWNRPGAWGVNDYNNNYHWGLEFTGMAGLACVADDARGAQYRDLWVSHMQGPGVVEFSGLGKGGATEQTRNYDLYNIANFAEQMDAYLTATGNDIFTGTVFQTFLQDAIYFSLLSASPDLAYGYSIGQETRVSLPALTDYDYHRIGAAMTLIGGVPQSDGKFWIDRVDTGAGPGVVHWDWIFPQQFLFYPQTVTGTDYKLTQPLTLFAQGEGLFIARNSWLSTATLWGFICGPQTQSHASWNANGINIYKGSWMLGGANIYSHTGNYSETSVYNNLTVGSTAGKNGQIGASKAILLKKDIGSDYIYLAGQAGGNYFYRTDTNGGTANIATDAVRKFVNIPANDVFVDFYRVVKADPTLTSQTLYHNIQTQTVAGQHSSWSSATAKLDIQAIYGTVSTIPDNLGPPDPSSHCTQVQIAGGNAKDFHLNVIQLLAVGGTPLEATLISTAVGRGVQIGNWVVMFGDTEGINSSFTYSFNGTNPTEHLLTDLPAGFSTNHGTVTANGTLRVSTAAGVSSLTITLNNPPLPPPPPIPTLASITVSPSPASVQVGGSITFTASGVGSDGLPFALGSITWTTTTGTISPQGILTAGNTAGPFTVTATSGKSGQAQVNVTSSSVKFVKPPQGATLNPNQYFTDKLAIMVPFNEGNGNSIKELVSGNSGVAGAVPFSWVVESSDFSGPSVNFTGATPVGVPASTLLRTQPVTGYSRFLMFKMADNVTGNTRIMDTDKTFAYGMVPQLSVVGQMTVTYRDSSNVAHLLTFNSPAQTRVMIGVTVSKGLINVYANLHNGVVINGMELQATAANCDLSKTWLSGQTVLPTTFYYVGVGTNVLTTPHVIVDCEELWMERLLSLSDYNTLWSNPFQMVGPIPSPPPAPAPEVGSITLAPANENVLTSATQQFTATVKDTNGNVMSNVSLNWTTTCPDGSVNGTGLFTAGVTVAPFGVTATALNGVVGSSSVNVIASPVVPPPAPPPVVLKTITLSPVGPQATSGQEIQFTATGTGNDNLPFTLNSLTWTIDSDLGGTVDNTGLYLAANKAGTYVITASQSGVSGQSSVTLAPLVPVPPGPPVIVPQKGNKNKTKVKTNSPNKLTVLDPGANMEA